MIACVFGLTACSGEPTYTKFEETKISLAENYAVEKVIPTLMKFMEEENVHSFDEYTPEEINYLVSDDYGFDADGYAFMSAVSSFYSAKESIGNVVEITENVVSEIDDDTIIVKVRLKGEKKDAEAEIIFSNDMFISMKSAALNPISSKWELMGRAVLNTIIGMGTVFVVLILISLIISCFGFIPKLEASLAEKKKGKTLTAAAGGDGEVSRTEEQDQEDDLELVAVIAAAIAASEGAASTDGFVVRSIRRRR